MEYKRLPYGIPDFTWIRSQNNYWIDKTMFIPKMEEAGYFLYLIRPRRLGKSVFLTMLQAYYYIEKLVRHYIQGHMDRIASDSRTGAISGAVF